MSDSFLDTNVFIYLFSRSEPAKQAVAERLVREGIEGGSVISYQVVQEALNVITRKLTVPATTEDARAFLDSVLAGMWRVMPSLALYERTLDVQARYQYGFYDSLIIASALSAGCDRLYSEDLHDGQIIEGLTIENPFKT